MDKAILRECQQHIRNWYVDGWVVTVRMDATSDADELCIQYMVVELLRDFIDNPIPEGLMEGSPSMDMWVEAAFQKVMAGLNFGFSDMQVQQVKNLAFNYYTLGITRVLRDPKLSDRVYKCYRKQQTMH